MKCSVEEILKELRSTGGRMGINWAWAFFSNEGDAQSFNQWCQANGYETRGVYPPGDNWGVRYR